MTQKRRSFIKTITLAGLGLGIIGNVTALYSQNSKIRELKIGVIGLDTSHVIAFAKAINDSLRPDFKGYKLISASYMGVRYGVTEKTARLFMFKVRETMEPSRKHPMDSTVHVDKFVIGGIEKAR